MLPISRDKPAEKGGVKRDFRVLSEAWFPPPLTPSMKWDLDVFLMVGALHQSCGARPRNKENKAEGHTSAPQGHDPNAEPPSLWQLAGREASHLTLKMWQGLLARADSLSSTGRW